MIGGPDRSELGITHWTLAGATVGNRARLPLPDRLAAAAAAGFRHVGLLGVEAAGQCRRDGGPQRLVALLAELGLRAGELEFLVDWALADGVSERELGLLGLAAQLGVGQVDAGLLDGRELPRPVLARRLAGLCDAAAEHGLTVAVEYVAGTAVPDAAAAVALIEDAGRANAGLLVDSWHSHRSGMDAAALRAVPGELVLSVQLSDGPATSTEPVGEETVLGRLLPGEGGFDLGGFVRALDATGARCPVFVEVLSQAQAARTLPAAAGLALTALRDVLVRADTEGAHP